MEEEFVYWRHITPIGVKVEEVTGGEGKTGRTWLAMARQIYCENGRDGLFRTILHLPSGAPLIEEEETRISITHTQGLFAVESAVNELAAQLHQTLNGPLPPQLQFADRRAPVALGYHA